ncbi:hypothetical protein [Chryseosolibacter indicus]|uniref:Uncharacterized protein n=1 Tax=Chryseosolibacter indicus TaxID=2782351 RepID=A0ABS5VP45_9BACT|nr:hypothetical protein [Chryseosolibacter indicus]MBT1702926.1 hypothetical protein [Chryseosolibacter indicus]
MKNLKKTVSKARNERATRLKGCICEILNCTQDQYAELVYNEGLKYLKYFLPDDADGQKMLSSSRVFWNWWKNHFINRDEKFIALSGKYPIQDKEMLLQLYLNYNDGKQLAQNLHPQSVVLEESYSEMIHSLLRKEVV